MTDAMHASGSSRSALVIEDEMLIAMMVEDILREGGYEVLGPVATVDDAMTILQSGQRVDVAVMDLNLAGSSSLPLADVMAQSRIPFVVMTGYGPTPLPAPHQRVPILSKPFTPSDLLQTLSGLDRSGQQ